MTIRPVASVAQRLQIEHGEHTLPHRHPKLAGWELLPDPEQPFGLPPSPLLADGTRQIPFPRIGAALDLTGPPINWDPPGLQDLFEPMPSVQVGILSSPGLMPLAKRFGIALYKVSVIVKANDDFKKRIRTLEHDRYGSCWENEHGIRVQDDHYDRWELNTWPDIPEGTAFQPVKVRHRYLDVCLPIGVSYHQFDSALTEALSTARLDQWIETTAGKRFAQRRGWDLHQLRRLTAYDYGGMNRTVCKAKEIIQLRPDKEARLFVALVEELLLQLSGWNGMLAS